MAMSAEYVSPFKPVGHDGPCHDLKSVDVSLTDMSAEEAPQPKTLAEACPDVRTPMAIHFAPIHSGVLLIETTVDGGFVAVDTFAQRIWEVEHLPEPSYLLWEATERP